MPTTFQRRILAERARALAARGAAPAIDLLPPRLVCMVGSRHVGLPMELVAAIRRFHCHPVPLLRGRARGTMLGLALIGRQLASVLELARLLALNETDPGPPAGGKMLLLRSGGPPVALRVDGVLGVMRLAASAQAGRALLPAGAVPGEPPPLVSLVEPDAIMAAIALLESD